MRRTTGTPAATTGVTPDPAAADALTPVLAAEHAMVWAYGTLGGRLPDDEQDRARTLLVAHERARDTLHAAILAAGGTPPVAEAAYELPFELTDAASARRLAAEIETRIAAVYATLVAASPRADLRHTGVTGLTAAALRAQSWGAPVVAFPGLPNE
jgi:hypothetical protein